MNSMAINTTPSILKLLTIEKLVEDEPLTLDGRDKTRLVNMAIQRQHRSEKSQSSHDNLLHQLRSFDLPMLRHRESNRRAILHWFLRGEDRYDVSWKLQYKPVHVAGEVLSQLDNGEQLLDEAEKAWENPIEKDEKVEAGQQYWASDSSDFWEARANLNVRRFV